MLQEFIETGSPVFLFRSTGTGSMEAAVRNCVREKLLLCANGSSKERFAKVAKANGREVVTRETELRENVQLGMIEAELEAESDAEAVAITHNETSVQLINDLLALTEMCRKHNKLVFVDAVSIMGDTMIKVTEWGI